MNFPSYDLRPFYGLYMSYRISDYSLHLSAKQLLITKQLKTFLFFCFATLLKLHFGMSLQLTKSNTLPWVFFMFFKSHKFYRIVQSVTYTGFIVISFSKCLMVAMQFRNLRVLCHRSFKLLNMTFPIY